MRRQLLAPPTWSRYTIGGENPGRQRPARGGRTAEASRPTTITLNSDVPDDRHDTEIRRPEALPYAREGSEGSAPHLRTRVPCARGSAGAAPWTAPRHRPCRRSVQGTRDHDDHPREGFGQNRRHRRAKSVESTREMPIRKKGGPAERSRDCDAERIERASAQSGEEPDSAMSQSTTLETLQRGTRGTALIEDERSTRDEHKGAFSINLR